MHSQLWGILSAYLILLILYQVFYPLCAFVSLSVGFNITVLSFRVIKQTGQGREQGECRGYGHNRKTSKQTTTATTKQNKNRSLKKEGKMNKTKKSNKNYHNVVLYKWVNSADSSW